MVKYLFRILYGCIALSILAGFWVSFFLRPHHYFIWERLPVFNALYGFVGCVVIILGSKALGRWWLRKQEGYYDEPEPPGRSAP
jgi:hypothetical protein